MRSVFPGYFRPDADTFRSLWSEGVIALDANVLLNLYRYTFPARDAYLQILKELQERLWLPHRAATEYLENRLAVSSEQEAAYDLLASWLRDAATDVEDRFRKRYPRHAIEIGKVVDGLRAAAASAAEALDAEKGGRPKYEADKDNLLDAITTLFPSSRIGAADQPPDALKKAEARFGKSQPPGTEDRHKGGERQYGDAILWLQLLEHAKATQKPVIFVTDDRKSDWWLRHNGKTIGPLPALVHEMRDYAGVHYYQYTPERFLEESNRFLRKKPEVQHVAEVRNVTKESTSAVPSTQLWRRLAAESDDAFPIARVRAEQRRAGAHLMPTPAQVTMAVEAASMLGEKEFSEWQRAIPGAASRWRHFFIAALEEARAATAGAQPRSLEEALQLMEAYLAQQRGIYQRLAHGPMWREEIEGETSFAPSESCPSSTAGAEHMASESPGRKRRSK